MQYLIFKVKGSYYSFDIEKVKEIIANDEKIHSIPKSKTHDKGVLNLRGDIIHILSLESLFSLEKIEETKPYVVVIENDGNTLGVEVDEVIDIFKDEDLKTQELTVINSPYAKNLLVNENSKDIYINLDIEKIIAA